MSEEIFRNQPDTTSPPTPLKWIGSTNENTTIPQWLSGIYFQVGPSDFDITAKGDTSVKQLQQALIQLKIIHFKHWFDGLSHVHRLEFQGGTDTALWSHSAIAKPYKEKIIESGTIDHTTFGQVVIENQEVSSTSIDSFKFKPPKSNDPNAAQEEEVYNNNLDIQTINYGNRDHIVVSGNTSIIEEINPVDLTSSKIGKLIHSSFYPTSHFIYTPFKKYDPITNELFSVVLEIGRVSSSFHILRTSFPTDANPEGKEPETTLLSSISNVRVGYVHSFAITEHFIIIVNCPYHAGTIGSGLKFSLNKASIQKTMKFSDLKDENTISYIVSRESGALIKSFESAGFFFLNIVNSFESGMHEEVSADGTTEKQYDVYLDVVAYTDSKVLNVLEIDQLRSQTQGDSSNVKININKESWTNTVRRYCLPGIPCNPKETAKIDPNGAGGVAYWEQVVENPSTLVNSLVKPFSKLYHTASGTLQPEDQKDSSGTGTGNIKLEELGSTSKNNSSSSSLELNKLNNKFDGSDLDIRFEFPASFHHLSNVTIEFPCINNDYNYKDYRFIYGLFHPKKENVFFTHLIKIDIQTMRVIKFDPLDTTVDPYNQEGDIVIPMMNEKVIIIPAGAPTFVPRNSDAIPVTETDDIDYTNEDNGALIVPFFDLLNRRSLIIVVDAKTFREIGRINLPEKEFMPFGSQSTFCNNVQAE